RASLKSDIYSLGTIILQLITKKTAPGKVPRDESQNLAQLQSLTWKKGGGRGKPTKKIATDEVHVSVKAKGVRDSHIVHKSLLKTSNNQSGCDIQTAEKITNLGIECTKIADRARPSIAKVIAVIEIKKGNIPDLQPYRHHGLRNNHTSDLSIATLRLTYSPTPPDLDFSNTVIPFAYTTIISSPSGIIAGRMLSLTRFANLAAILFVAAYCAIHCTKSSGKFVREVRWQKEGDSLARYLVRISEMTESIKIIQRALEGIPGEAYENLEIRRFDRLKHPEWTDFTIDLLGIRVFFLGDGRFAHRLVKRMKLDDIMTILGSIDIIIGEEVQAINSFSRLESLQEVYGIIWMLVPIFTSVLALTIGVLVIVWLERERSAGIQQRIGPEYAGPLGILQALADGPDHNTPIVDVALPYGNGDSSTGRDEALAAAANYSFHDLSKELLTPASSSSAMPASLAEHYTNLNCTTSGHEIPLQLLPEKM
ncbi:hypothetical protein RJ639_008323, partial [Escallonia herrerae]